jgi:hypothetical protein
MARTLVPPAPVDEDCDTTIVEEKINGANTGDRNLSTVF